jgi:hydroxypyruvate reductase
LTELRKDAEKIVAACIRAVRPDEAVKRALKSMERPAGRILIVAAGKAAWQMAKAASEVLECDAGIVITKYDHVKGDIPGIKCFEAGHPVPDENGFRATEAVLDLVSGLTEDDLVVFLLSGGGSALFELPLISGDELKDITAQMLACGAGIVEMNTVRKRLSAVKGGRFALRCSPAKVFSIVLSDIIGDPLDMIASGPAYPDSSTCEQALEIVKRYDLKLSEDALRLLEKETPEELDNVTTVVTGSVRELCRAAEEECRELGYRTVFLTDRLECEASEAGRFLGAIARSHAKHREAVAFIAGGETVVHLRGRGLGGRNQELALAAAPLIEGLEAVVFAFGSDGTDGPTDAAGGYVDGDTMRLLIEAGMDINEVLSDNDAYHALKSTGGLIITGPTGTNVNDAYIVLIK